MGVEQIMTDLFQPAQAGALRLANRITMAPLTRKRAGEDGVPTDLHVEYYAQRASVGFLVTEGTFPSFRSRGFEGQAGIANAEQQEGWRRVARAVHDRGGVLVMQVMHAGRMAPPPLTRGEEPEAPSAIAPGVSAHTPHGKMELPVPRALATAELSRVIEEFVAGARRAIDAGVDAVEIHGANGYLLHEFLSPVSNTRTDAYGGTPQARARFVVELVRAVAAEVGADRVGLRISPEHNIQGVLEEDPQDALATYEALIEGIKDLGLAYLSILHKDYKGELVTRLRELFGGFVVLNSGFQEVTDLTEAEDIMGSGLADAVAVGRELIANPDLVRRWREGLELNPIDFDTFYTPGEHGYTDYPFASAEA